MSYRFLLVLLSFLVLLNPVMGQNITESVNVLVYDGEIEITDAWNLEGRDFSLGSVAVLNKKPKDVKAVRVNDSGSVIREVDVSIQERDSLYWLNTPAKGNVVFSYKLDVKENDSISFSHPVVLYDELNESGYLVRNLRIEDMAEDYSSSLGYPKKHVERTNFFTRGMEVKSVYENRDNAKEGRTFRVHLDNRTKNYENLFERVEIKPSFSRPSKLEYTISKEAREGFDGYSYFIGQSSDLIDIPKDSITVSGNPETSFVRSSDAIARSECNKPLYTVKDIEVNLRKAKTLNLCVPGASQPRFTVNFETFQNLESESLGFFRKKLTYQVLRHLPENPPEQEIVLVEPNDYQISYQKGDEGTNKVDGRAVVRLEKGKELDIVVSDPRRKKLLYMNSVFLLFTIFLSIISITDILDFRLREYLGIFLTYSLTLISSFGLDIISTGILIVPLLLSFIFSLPMSVRFREGVFRSINYVREKVDE